MTNQWNQRLLLSRREKRTAGIAGSHVSRSALPIEAAKASHKGSARAAGHAPFLRSCCNHKLPGRARERGGDEQNTGVARGPYGARICAENGSVRDVRATAAQNATRKAARKRSRGIELRCLGLQAVCKRGACATSVCGACVASIVVVAGGLQTRCVCNYSRSLPTGFPVAGGLQTRCVCNCDEADPTALQVAGGLQTRCVCNTRPSNGGPKSINHP
jgi:hypothetical protein